MNRINLNELAKEVTLAEGLKESVSIGQVKEVMKLVLIELAEMEPWDATETIHYYRKKYVD